jgi:hypothetical protein
MNIGEPRRTIYIEPIEEPASAPLEEPRGVPEQPADPPRSTDPEPAR